MPSDHVCRSLVLLEPPQLLNQEPPRPQQLLFPDFGMVPHLGHTEVMVVVVAGDGFYADIDQTQKKNKNAITFTECRGGLQHVKVLDLRLQASTPSNQR